MGFSGISGDMLLRGDLADLVLLGVGMFAELARRDGVIPLTEWREFIDALRNRVGVADRDDGTTEADVLRRGLRIALLGRGEFGDREWSATGFRGVGPAGRAERGVLAGEEVAMVRRFKDCAKSPSPPRPPLAEFG